MPIDISQFIQGFIEDSFENVETAEQGLLELDQGNPDPEVLNGIFRAVHSIKGMSGTFGMDDVATFTHVAENYLDLLRTGAQPVRSDGVTALLEGLDHLRVLFECHKAGRVADSPAILEQRARLLEHLQVFIRGGPAPAATATPGDLEVSAPEAEVAGLRWLKISFRPHAELFATGNDPVLILRELATLGEVTVQPQLDRLPPVDEFDAEQAYLGWEIALHTDRSEDDVSEVFDWVDDLCDLTIEAVGDTAPALPASIPAAINASISHQLEAEDAAQEITEDRAEAPPVIPPAVPKDAAPTAEPKSAPKASDPAPDPAPAQSSAPAAVDEPGTLRVSVDKVDHIVDLVGELIITRSVLRQIIGELDSHARDRLEHALTLLERNTRDLQESVMSVRLLPIGQALQRARSAAQTLASTLGKRVSISLEGEEIEVDKAVLECLTQVLHHLTSNAVIHGVRSTAQSPGQLSFEARHEGGEVVVVVSDDGPGIDYVAVAEVAAQLGHFSGSAPKPSHEHLRTLLVREGISTVGSTGAGLDAAQRTARTLGGEISIGSGPDGVSVTVRLPMTMAILDAQLVLVGEETFIVPLTSIVESLLIDPNRRHQLTTTQEVYSLRSESLPIVDLAAALESNYDQHNAQLLVVVENDGEKVGLLVTGLLGQQQVVVKSLEDNYESVPGLSGATILGDGSVALILDIAGVIQLATDAQGRTTRAAS